MNTDLHLWTDDEEFVIAEDVDDARAVMREIGYVAIGGEEIDFTMKPDDRPFTFDDGNAVNTKTAREWCVERGRGYFCASNY